MRRGNEIALGKLSESPKKERGSIKITIPKISKEQFVLQMSPNNPPVFSIPSHSAIAFETLDCFSNEIESEEQLFSSVGWDKINPATGPLFVEGAEPGDVLKVEILKIKVADRGVMTVAPKFGVLGDIIQREITKLVDIQEGMVRFNEKISLPIRPMIGVIGTSPAAQEIPTGTPGEHGGNMDCKRIVEGSTLYLPVKVPGALLSMGDLHAVMGDGEVVICGVEISGEITVRLSVIKDKNLPLPMLREGDHVMTIASADSLDEAAKQATVNMHKFLVEQVGIDVTEAGMLMSIAGDLKICQVVDPLVTSRMEFPLSVLSAYGYNLY
ncbi:MAG: acetamidase/formamidase family protein [Desulfitobacteriaceae bacterium]